MALERIKLPYATKHCLDNSFITVHNKMLNKDTRPDDCFITKKYQEDTDCEPQSVQIDQHTPSANPIVKQDPLPTISEIDS